jgi:hypothetical protein
MTHVAHYTTEIEPEQAISEIQKMLSRQGVSAMITEYDGPRVSAVSFLIKVDGQPTGFRLPCNWKSRLRDMHAESREAQYLGRQARRSQGQHGAYILLLRRF